MTTFASRKTVFYEKLRREWRLHPTCDLKGHTTCNCLVRCVKVGLLKEWMNKQEAGSAKTNGELMFEEVKPIEGLFPDPASDILESCTIVFSWLVESDYGRLIRIFHDAGINDVKLRDPTYSLDGMLMLKEELRDHATANVDFDTLVVDLERSRWKFCPCFLDRNMDLRNEIRSFGNKLYMPFCRQWSVASAEAGGTADVFLVHIQEEFVSEDVKQYLGLPVEDKPYGRCYRLAIKKISGNRFTTYNKERRAFKGLRAKRGILRSLGFYSLTGSEDYEDVHYNILLEYAEMNLHEFFKAYDPPQLAAEIYSQWNEFCQVAYAIETLHGFDYEGSVWSGWHGDIKPRNLLYVGGEWKLADYGFAVFRKGSPDNRLVAKLSECSETWGAPETVDHDNHVDQTVDTWSFGCVLSVMATWIVRGYRGVQEYEEFRLHASKQLNRTSHPSDTFHDGENVLPEIRQWHEHLKRITRRCDNITHRILDIVDDYLLSKDIEVRLTSTKLRAKLDHEISVAGRSLTDDSWVDGELLKAVLPPRLRHNHNSFDPHDGRIPTEDKNTGLMSSPSPVTGWQVERTVTSGPEPFSPTSITQPLPAMKLQLEQSVMSEFEAYSPTPIIQTPNDSRPPSLRPHDSREATLIVGAHLRPNGDMSSVSRYGLSHTDLPRLNTDISRGSFSSVTTTVPESLPPIDRDRTEATMVRVWESVKVTEDGGRELLAYLLDEKPWIAHQIDEKDGCTPIMIAAKNSNLRVVKLLVQHSDLSQCDKSQMTVLHHLIWAQHDVGENSQVLDILSCILGPGNPPTSMFSSVDWPDGDRCTPIIIAARNDQLNVVKLLAEHSDLSLCDRYRQTVLHHLIRVQSGKRESQQFLETLRCILDHYNSPESVSSWINKLDDGQHTCLGLCVGIGHMPETIKDLLRRGALVDVTNIRAENIPLAIAAKKGSERTVEIMLKYVVEQGISAGLRDYLRKEKKSIDHSVWRLIEAKIGKESSRTTFGFRRKVA